MSECGTCIRLKEQIRAFVGVPSRNGELNQAQQNLARHIRKKHPSQDANEIVARESESRGSWQADRYRGKDINPVTSSPSGDRQESA